MNKMAISKTSNSYHEATRVQIMRPRPPEQQSR